MTYYGQRDSRWASERLGSSDASMGGYGCAVTSLAMLCEYIGIPTTPSTLNKWLTKNDGFQDGNLVIWTAINRYSGGRLNYSGAPKLFSGPFPQIAEVDLIPDDSDFDQHFVLMLDATTCWDPWLNRKRNVSDFKGVKSYRVYNYSIPVIPDNSGGSMADQDKEYRSNYYIALNDSIAKTAPRLDLPVPQGWADKFDVLRSFTQQYVERLGSKMDDLARVSAEVEDTKTLNKTLTEQLLADKLEIKDKTNGLALATAQIELLNKQLAAAKASFDWSRFTSRKWLTGLIAAAIPLLNHFFNWNLDATQVISTITPLALFIGFEGWADIKSRQQE